MSNKLGAHTTLVRSDPCDLAVRCLVLVKGMGWQVKSELLAEIEASNQLKSLILAQIERWRHALHMQVERGEGATPHSVANG